MICSESVDHEPLSITVRSLRAQREGSEILVGVVLENGEHREQKNLILTVEQYYELKPTRGRISEELFDRMEEASTLCTAIRCGENLLSYGANSVQMLAQKLVRHGYRREVAHTAAHKLQEMGLINEESDLQREVEKCLRKLWGAKRIKSHLWTRGFGNEVMANLPELLESVDFTANCATLIRKHYVALPEDADGRRRMIASLCRYGYSINEIREACQSISEE